jgi:OFA family oxalate/formate antiporter-like MFS transporter
VATTDTTQTPPETTNTEGWTVALSALGINLVLGALYAWGVLAKALVGTWQWTKTEASLPFTVATASFAITMIFAGRLQDRIGPRVVTLLGGLVFGGALIASGFVHSPLAMAMTFGVIGGIGIGLGYSATTPPSIKWFPPERKGLITGIVVSGVGIAAVYIGPLTEYLLAYNTIPKTFIYIGIGAIAVVAILSQFVKNPPVGYKPRSSGTQAAALTPSRALTGTDTDWPAMLSTPQFYVLWAMFIMSASAGLMIIAHVAIIAREQAGMKWGFMPIAMLAIFNTAGRIISGYVSDRIGRRNTMLLAFSLQAVNMFLFMKYTTPALVMFGAAFTGICYGAIFTLMPASIADFYGLRNLGVNYGVLFTAFGVAGVAGPLLAGRIRDLNGSYTTAFVLSGVLLILGAALTMFLKPPKHAGT